MPALRTLVALLLALTSVSQTLAQDPPASQPALTPEMERQIERERIELEAADLPKVAVARVEDVVKFELEHDVLAVRTTLTPHQGQVRVINDQLPGVVRLHVRDLQPLGDDSTGRNFSFVQQDLTRPGTSHVYTHVSSIAGQIVVARDAESDETTSSIQLIQNPPRTPPEPGEHPVRLLVKITDNADGILLVNLELGAYSFTDLRRQYPRELETYFRPILRDFGQDHSLFAVDDRIAWQVLGSDLVPDARAAAAVNEVLKRFDSDDFREREAAVEQLKQLGQPAAMVLARADRADFSPEQSAGVDTFLAEYLQLSADEVKRLKESPEFLLDTLATDDPNLRRLALAQLKRITSAPVAFDSDASPDARATQLEDLRRALITVPMTTPAPAPAPAPALTSEKPRP